jgi:hypothetical protein
MKNKTFLFLSCLCLASCFGCGMFGSDSSSPAMGGGSASTTSITVGGTASKIAGTVVLQNNGGDDLTLSSDGTFNFQTASTEGASYNVTVKTQPVGRTCTVSNGSGTVGSSSIINVSIQCSAFSGIADGTLLSNTGSWEVLQ